MNPGPPEHYYRFDSPICAYWASGEFGVQGQQQVKALGRVGPCTGACCDTACVAHLWHRTGPAFVKARGLRSLVRRGTGGVWACHLDVTDCTAPISTHEHSEWTQADVRLPAKTGRQRRAGLRC